MVTGIAAGHGSSPAAPTMEQKKSGENRRSNKPIMEKRRRARINNCLNELKALILDAMKKDPARHSKLEKADILEMTVKHLEDLRSESGGTSDRFRAGFRHCASEVARFPGLDPALKKRLLSHLDTKISQNDSTSSDSEETLPTAPSSPQSTILISTGTGSGLRLVPTRLSNGDIALVLPPGVGMGMGTLRNVPTLVPLSPRASSSSTSSDRRCFSPESSGWDSPPPDEPVPLALVTRREPEEKPWRPW